MFWTGTSTIYRETREHILFLNIDLTIFTRHLVISLFLNVLLNLIAYN